MKALKVTGGYVLRLEPGEEVVETLRGFMEAKNVKSCWFSGLGAVNGIELAYYDLAKRKYLTKKFPDDMEVVSLTGNASWLGGKPAVHMHVVLAGSGLKTVAGHLMKADVSATLEVYAACFGKPIERKMDQASGLNLMDLQ